MSRLDKPTAKRELASGPEICVRDAINGDRGALFLEGMEIMRFRKGLRLAAVLGTAAYSRYPGPCRSGSASSPRRW
jgi:hypothetical protein